MTKPSRGCCLSIRLFLLSLLIIGMANTLTPSQTYITYQEAVASLKTNRDRLLDSYALQTGRADRHEAWSQMSSSQKGVFLTITDLLGRRTFTNYNSNYVAIYQPRYEDELGGCALLTQQLPEFPSVENGAYITWGFDPNLYGHNYPDPYEVCEFVDRNTCVNVGSCVPFESPRIDFDMALNHVTTLYAINGANGSSCGGGEYNRMYFSVDDMLLFKLRNLYSIMPEWGEPTDPAGPHSPFTQSRETNGGFWGGFPKGQSHQWAWDYEASVLTRNGVYGVFDPHVVEMDIDYELSGHPSNPDCYYGGELGRYKYQNKWWNLGLGGSAEFNYSPF